MKNIFIFDFFGVIGDEVADMWLTNRVGHELATSFRTEVISKADLGLIREDELFDEVGKLTGMTREQALRGWLDTVKIKKGTVAVIRELKKQGHTIVLLSNAPHIFLHRILSRDNLYYLFDFKVISCEVGIAKPNPDIYDIVLKQYQGKYQKIYFIDDNIHNVIASRNMGIEGILFEDEKSLIKKIGRL